METLEFEEVEAFVQGVFDNLPVSKGGLKRLTESAPELWRFAPQNGQKNTTSCSLTGRQETT